MTVPLAKIQRDVAFKADPNHPRCPETGKLRYRTMSSAENALKEVLLRGSMKQKAYRTYHCEACDGWHLTSQERRRSY